MYSSSLSFSPQKHFRQTTTGEKRKEKRSRNKKEKKVQLQSFGVSDDDDCFNEDNGEEQTVERKQTLHFVRGECFWDAAFSWSTGMASIAGLYGGFGTNPEDGGGGRTIFAKFKKDLIKEQANLAAQRREE